MAYKNPEDQAAAAKRHYEANKEKIKARSKKEIRSLEKEIRNTFVLLKVYTNALTVEKIIQSF